MFGVGVQSTNDFRRKAKQHDSGTETCPNSGTRPPECAAGRAIEYLELLINFCDGKVPMHATLLNAS